MKKFVLSLLCLMTFLFLGIAQAAQIDGLQNNDGPPLPTQLGVYVNPGHLGDALIGGYYNARNAITQISLVNTSATQGVAVKVRFREGKFSNEVLDFYVCLSAGDRWTAWVTGDDDPTNPAVVYPVDDDTPTYPAFGVDGERMKYGTNAAPCVTADMTKEGYFTVIGAQSWADTPGENKIIATSDECGEQLIGINEVNAPGFDQMTGDEIEGPADSLAGTVNIWDYVAGAADYSYNMLALSNFLDNPLEDLSLAVDSSPLFDDSDTNGAYDGIDAVNYVLMKECMIAFYDIRSWLGAQSDVIITFPTKRETLGAGGQNPFQPDPVENVCAWDADFCEPVQFTLWDDAEHKCGCEESGFSPREYECDDSLDLCHEVNYIVIGEGAVPILNTILGQDLYCDDPDYPFDIGWINFAFDWDGGITACPTNRVITLDATPSVSSFGLPALGYELGSIVEGWWGHMLELRYTSDVSGDDG